MYVGQWLPEPVNTSPAASPDARLMMSSSVTTAFLLMLERLTPKERSAYLLREVFDVPYPEIAQTLSLREATVRKLVSRALANLAKETQRHATPVERQQQLLAAFESAVVTGDTTDFAKLLADDIELWADGGGKATAINRTLRGPKEIAGFVAKLLHHQRETNIRTVTSINGGLGIVAEQDGRTISTLACEFDAAGQLCRMYIMRNPDKLTRVGQPPIL
ncbi:MAG: hypothetical protein JWM57_1552 [Phycisphaerales bacterium]|nr:hypothetical protein [Phycisphaerales bacterium]